MSKIVLYHGSPEIIEVPIFGKGKAITIMVRVFIVRSISSLRKNGRVRRVRTDMQIGMKSKRTD